MKSRTFLKIPFVASFILIPLLVAFRGNKAEGPTANARPNILYIVADDAGRDMSAYGVKWVNTPAFDRIAREGILFNNAYTPNAKCAPSRAIMLTGRNSWQLDAGMNHVNYFPNYFKTYPEVLAEQGYFVGYTGKGWGPGKALREDGSPREFLKKSYAKHKLTPPAQYINVNDYAANFADFVKDADGQPWCFWLGFTEPHREYEYGAGIKKGGKTPDMIDRVPAYFPDSLTVRTDLLDYAYEIEYLDSHVARVLKTLEASGQLENTLIVYTSDHGMPFPRVKGNAYENSNHVPFAVMWKNGIKNPGRTIDDYVNMTDLAPTFLDAAGDQRRRVGHEAHGGDQYAQLVPKHQKRLDRVRAGPSSWWDRSGTTTGGPTTRGTPSGECTKTGCCILRIMPMTAGQPVIQRRGTSTPTAAPPKPSS